MFTMQTCAKPTPLPIDWSQFYKWASLSSILMLLLVPIQIIIFVASPPPETVEGFFQLFHDNWLLGLLSLDLIYILNNVILILIYLALFLRMFYEKPSICLTALTLGLISIACYFPSNPSFEMLTLSIKYYKALPVDQIKYLAAGEAMIAGYSGTSFDVYYVLGAITLILFSYAILRSKYFKKHIGLWGMASGVLMSIPSSAGSVGLIFSLLSLIPWIVFVALLVYNFKEFSCYQMSPSQNNS